VERAKHARNLADAAAKKAADLEALIGITEAEYAALNK